MPILGNPRFSRTLSLTTFERLQTLLQQMEPSLGEGVVVLTENLFKNEAIASQDRGQRFTIVVSPQFSVLLLGERQEQSPAPDEKTNSVLYQVGLTFEPKAIATFLTQLARRLKKTTAAPLDLLDRAKATLQPNDAAIQSEFTLSLIEILSRNETSDAYQVAIEDVTPPTSPNSHTPLPTCDTCERDLVSVSAEPDFSPASFCKPMVDEALYQQIEQERLLNQVISQIRQSLELPVILETAVEQVRHFLQAHRLVIYQFDFDRIAQIPNPDGGAVLPNSELPALAPSNVPSQIETSPVLTWGCVTYEARVSDAIPSVLNLTEQEECYTYAPNCREKYHQGLTFAIDDIELAYIAEPCLLQLLQKIRVRAKLVAPIVVQNSLWGLLIAHQCFEPRQWQENEKLFLSQIAGHLSIAIYQARLYAQLQQQKITLERRVIERTQELRDALEAAQSASVAKGDFLAAMSHELRTPLTCIIGMSATLLRWSFGQQGERAVPVAKQRRYLQTIQESGEHLLELINDILDFSQVEAGKAILNVSEFSLSKLTHQVLRTLQEKADLQQVYLQMDWQVEGKGDRFCADQRRVKQILFNLVGNAIKFTPAGGRVTLRGWRENNLAVFQVEDTGIGIAPEQMPLLFQKFQQLDSSYHRNYEGTGLGLALTKQLVELHGGRIEVESMVGQGSFFTVWLPAQPLVSPSLAKGTATPKKNSIPQGSIVLLDAHEDTAVPISEILTGAGYHVVWLIDGSTAVEQIELLQPQAVIVDWQLPGMDGYEIISCLRNSPTIQNIKVLALTNPTLLKDQERELNAIADDYLLKPVELMPLLHKVTALVAT